MADPEITREEAAADAALAEHYDFGPETALARYGRTVLALYDRLDEAVAERDAARHDHVDWKAAHADAVAAKRAMRECIDRLRSGYHWESGASGPPKNYGWVKGDEIEEATPEQAAVMADG
jgi:hypothetical protein